MAKIVSVVNQKGGVGKTTTSIEIASFLTMSDKKVLLVDFDQQCNATMYSKNTDNSCKYTIWDVLNAKCSTKNTISKSKYYDYIMGSAELSKAEKTFLDHDAIYYLGDVLESVASDYDYIIIDNSPSRNILLNMAYAASDAAILVTECDDGSISGLKQILGDINALKTGKHSVSHMKIAGIVLNKYENTIMHQTSLEALDMLKEKWGIEDAFVSTVRKTVKLSEVKSFKTTLQEGKNYFSSAAQDFRMVVHNLMDNLEDK